MQEMDEFNIKTSLYQLGLEKYMTFTINNKLSFIDSFHFESSS